MPCHPVIVFHCVYCASKSRVLVISIYRLAHMNPELPYCYSIPLCILCLPKSCIDFDYYVLGVCFTISENYKLVLSSNLLAGVIVVEFIFMWLP